MWDELFPRASLLVLDDFGRGEGKRGERREGGERENREEGRTVEQACRWTASTLERFCTLQMCPEQIVRGQPAEASLFGHTP